MKSCLYSCKIHHSRTRPKKHAFDYRLFYFSIDLDELGMIAKNPFIGIEQEALYSLKTSDHLDYGQQSIKENLVKFLQSEGHTAPIGRIKLITQLRTFGHLFNPVSFYFVDDQRGSPACIVAEVANTFNEQKLYYLGPETINKTSSRDAQPKYFYISPFSELNTNLHFNLQFPEQRLNIQIRQSDNEGIYFNSSITGTRLELDTSNLAHMTLRFPFTTLQILWGIHWQALQLFLKKIPYYSKDANRHMERRIRNYLTKRHSINHHPIV